MGREGEEDMGDGKMGIEWVGDKEEREEGKEGGLEGEGEVAGGEWNGIGGWRGGIWEGGSQMLSLHEC
jgi:hypothetical protein